MKNSHGQKYHLIAYVIMNDHFNAILKPLANQDIDRIVQSWKSYNSFEFKRLSTRKEPVWRDEYEIEILDDYLDLRQKLEYLISKPFKKWHDLKTYEWVEYKDLQLNVDDFD